MNVLFVLALVLAASVFMVCGTQGFYTILGIFTNIGVFFLLVFGFHQRWPILWLTVAGFLVISLITLFFVNGWNLQMQAAFISVLLFLLVFLCVVPLTARFSIQGFTAVELDELSHLDTTIPIDFGTLSQSLLLISLSGAVLDASVAVSSGTFEVFRLNPDLSFQALVRSSLTIAKKILASTVITLLFAFIGSTLALVIWFIDLEHTFQQIINEKAFVMEYLSAILTTAAAVLVLPITSFISSFVFTRRGKATRDGEKVTT